MTDGDSDTDVDFAPPDLSDDEAGSSDSEESGPQRFVPSDTSRRVIVVPDDKRLSSQIMTKAEVTRAIAIRAEQISRYPNAFVDVGKLSRAEDIAQKELYAHRSPLVLRRIIGRTPANEDIVEKWKVREMTYPTLK